jgi:Xaa-Pro aminopeptidase
MEINLFDKDIYVKRRAALMDNFSTGNMLFLGNQESSVNFKDNWYPFRQDSTFLYYFGLNIPDLNVILDCNSGETIMFGDELTMDDIIWTGPLPTLKELAEKVGISSVKPTRLLKDYVNHATHFLPAYRPEHKITLSRLTGYSIAELDKKHSTALIENIVNQRNDKSAEEIKT